MGLLFFKSKEKKEEMREMEERKRSSIARENAYKEFCSNPTVQRLLQSMLSEFTFPLPLLHLNRESPIDNPKPYLLVKETGAFRFRPYTDRIECLDTFDPEHHEQSLLLWQYTFLDHGFSLQPDRQKQEFVIEAFSDLIVPEYQKRYPNVSASGKTYVDITRAKQVPNPNYNTAKW